MPFKEAFHTLYALALAGLLFAVGVGLAMSHHLIAGLVMIGGSALLFAGWLYTAPWKECIKQPLIVGFLIATVYYLQVIKTDEDTYQLAQPSGDLIPASDNDPFPGRDVAAVIFGGNLFFFSHLPATVVTLDGRPVLTVDKNDRGLSVSLILYDVHRDVILRLINNHLVVDKNVLEFTRDDYSSLRIIDRGGNEVINIHMDDGKTLNVYGLIIYNDDPLVVTHALITDGHNVLVHNTIANDRPLRLEFLGYRSR